MPGGDLASCRILCHEDGRRCSLIDHRGIGNHNDVAESGQINCRGDELPCAKSFVWVLDPTDDCGRVLTRIDHVTDDFKQTVNGLRFGF